MNDMGILRDRLNKAIETGDECEILSISRELDAEILKYTKEVLKEKGSAKIEHDTL